MTSYDITALMVLANVAAEPLVYKVTSKAFLGTLTIALMVVLIGYLSLKRKFYDFDAQPEIVILNGKVERQVMKHNRMNLPFLMSLIRLQGYANVSEIEFAIIEPNGNLSIIPKSQNRPVTPKDLNLTTKYEGLALPLIIDGIIMKDNLKYANLTLDWLQSKVKKAGANDPSDVFLAELSTTGELFVDVYKEQADKKPMFF